MKHALAAWWFSGLRVREAKVRRVFDKDNGTRRGPRWRELAGSRTAASTSWATCATWLPRVLRVVRDV